MSRLTSLSALIPVLLAGCNAASDSGNSSPAPAAAATRTTTVAASVPAPQPVVASAPAPQQPVAVDPYSYTMTDLGNMTAYGLDDQDNVVGEVYTDNLHAAILPYNGTLTILPDSGYSTAHASNQGIVVGFSGADPAQWQNNAVAALGVRGEAYGVNASDAVIGTVLVPDGAYNTQHGTIWSGGTSADLGQASDGRALNNLGNATGIVTSTDTGLSYAFYYDGSTVASLGTLPCDSSTTFGSQGFGINNNNAIVGDSCAGDVVTDPLSGQPSVPTHAFLYLNGVFTDLGTLETDAYAPASSSSANAINDLNETVGGSDATRAANAPNNVQHAFVYTNALYDLNTLLATPNTGVILTNAVSINCNSDIVANGLNVSDGTYHAYLLVRVGSRRC